MNILFNNEFKGLNDAQLDAVITTEGYVRVVAAAGSGKTKALTCRFAYLVNELGVLPGNILCVTFTNKAANEMRQRIHDMIGDNDTGFINTFHGFCVSVLQEDSHAVNYPKKFLVLDNEDINDMLKVIYEERGLTLRDMTFSAARDMIEIEKLFNRPDYYLDLISMSAEQLQIKYREAEDAKDIIFYGYLYQEKKCFGLDYNDLIKFSLYIFKENNAIKLKWQQRLEYIMIDEFQDIDSLQYELMEVLCGYHNNLFIVGDPDQTIYTWRGANVKYLLDFPNKFPDVKTIMMVENYRSTPEILACANSLISKNTNRIPKNLIPMHKSSEKVECHFAESQIDEAKWIAETIKNLAEMDKFHLRDITILYRAHYVTRALEEVFIEEKIPYTIYSGVQFFGRQEIKDALCYLRMIAFQDDLSFRRIVNVPKRNIGKRRMAALEEYSAAHSCSLYNALKANVDEDLFKTTKASQFIRLIDEMSKDYEGVPVTEILSVVLDKSGYEKQLRTEGDQNRLDNLAELRQSVFDFETTAGEEVTLTDYLRHVAMYTNADAPEDKDKVKLMTVHAAKGLEFPCVFLCGMNEGVFPSRKLKTKDEMEEERRLAFVALTRAEKRLYISEAAGWNFDSSPRYPSRFILDIDEKLMNFTPPLEEGLVHESNSYYEVINRRIERIAQSKELWEIGSKVNHAVFGDGEILEVDDEMLAYLIKFEKISTPRKISAKVALLTKI